MHKSDWERLSAPFAPQSIEWRTVEIAADGRAARVQAQLSQAALIDRLDGVVGRESWSLRLSGHSNGVICQLEIGGVCKSAVAEEGPLEGSEACARAAFARAAMLFGMSPPGTETEQDQWVDYDPDERLALLPEAPLPAAASLPGARPMPAAGEADSAAGEPSRAGAIKPAGQQAIDRLVERLRLEGKGLPTARLLVEYGGYGTDPETARELYGKLRQLLAAEVPRES